MSFQGWFSHFSVQPKESVLPLLHHFCQSRETKRKEKEEKKEREKPHLLLPCFGITKRGKQIKLLPLHLPFLIFSTNEGRRREKTPFFPPIFIFFAVFFFLVSASPRMEKKNKKQNSFLPFLIFGTREEEKRK